VLNLPDRWIWDSWTADDGERHHLYFLQAPSALGDPGLRHTAATIGHATSTDLRRWEVHADALGPGPEGFDDLAEGALRPLLHVVGAGRLAHRAMGPRLSLELGDPIAVGLDADGYLTAV
jgi:hypothetical protein